MTKLNYDIMVLGAGVVGISTAIHLRRNGLTTLLVDRRGPAEETSFGNAGIIQCEAVHPYLFPRDIGKLVAYAFNRRVEAHYQLRDLPHVAPFLLRYLLASNPASARKTFNANLPIFRACLDSHGELADAAGSTDLIRRDGWIRIFRSRKAANSALPEITELQSLGMSACEIDQETLRKLEPHMSSEVVEAAFHYADPWTLTDPGALVRSYFDLFLSEGGSFLTADAATIQQVADGFAISGEEEEAVADKVVVALGPWSRALLSGMGVDLPMGVKRGYHRHYKPIGNGFLNRSLVDDRHGFVMSPMVRGIRLTSGAEFARIDSPKTPVQLDRALPYARELFRLGEPVEKEAWMGSRPVFPDMLPAIGEVKGLPGVYANFGHAHHGLTLGPATGKLLAQMIAGAEPYCDPVPYSPNRFL